jgi:hypothetical protein
MSCSIEEIVPHRYQPRLHFSTDEQRQLLIQLKKMGSSNPSSSGASIGATRSSPEKDDGAPLRQRA